MDERSKASNKTTTVLTTLDKVQPGGDIGQRKVQALAKSIYGSVT